MKNFNLKGFGYNEQEKHFFEFTWGYGKYGEGICRRVIGYKSFQEAKNDADDMDRINNKKAS